MARGHFSDLLVGYEGDAEYGTKYKSVSITGNVTRQRSRFVRRILDFSRALLNCFSYTSTRSYGLFLIGFGFFSFLLHTIRNYTAGDQIPLYVIICSVALALFGIPLVCFDKQLAIAMQDFTVTDYVFFEFFCLKRMHRINPSLSRGAESRVLLIKPYVALIVGLLLAAFTMLVPMWWILTALGGLIYLFLTFISPEFSFFSIILAMPYLPLLAFSDLVLGIAVLVTFLSFAVKVALGKRVYHFEQYDLILALFLVFVLISGIFVKGIASFGASLILVLFAMGYVLSSSLISNRRLADCLIKALIISAIPVSANAAFLGIRSLIFDGLDGFVPVSASFKSADALAIYLLVTAIFTLYYIKVSRSIAARLWCGVTFLLILLALLSTASMWAFVAGAFGICAYLFTKLRRTGPIFVGVLSFLPYLLLFLGERVLLAIDSLPFASGLRLGELADRWSASFKMLLDNIFVGVGIGSDSFSREIVYYSTEKYTDSANLLLEIGCEAGIFALITFIVMILVRLFHRISYRRYVAVSEVRYLSSFASVAMCVLLVFGATSYLFSDLDINLLYWCVFGIGSAALRVAKREHDDRIGYYSDGRSSDASAMDIELL